MKAHILVVDDDPRITDLLRRILAYEGYSVAIAASGNEEMAQTCYWKCICGLICPFLAH